MQELKDTNNEHNETDLDINKVHDYLRRLEAVLFPKLDNLGPEKSISGA